MPSLSTEQIAQLNADGYLLIRGALDPALDLEPVEHEFAAILDQVAADLHESGAITQEYEGLPFDQRFIAVAREASTSIMWNFEIGLPISGFTADSPINCGRATFDLLRSPRLLDLLEPLIGSEIFVNPVHHTRIKLPPSVGPRAGNLTDASPWHQDQGVVLPEADRTNTITVWISMTDADTENGCLIYERRSHRSGLAFHCPWEAPNRRLAASIPEEWIDEEQVEPVPTKRGDILIHLPLTKHGSLPNVSNTIRWSFDLRYQPTGQPTGRPMFPGFVARSRSDPDSELTSAAEWSRLWEQTRDRLASEPVPKLFRWNTEAEACA
jgi:hypothetical protein